MLNPFPVVIGAALADIPLAPVGPGVFDAHSTPVERVAMHVGGDAANEALALARLGHAPALVSKVGQDAAGDFVLNALTAAGVNTAPVLRDPNIDTSINIVLVRADGERSFITGRTGSLRRLALADILPALDSPALQGATVACLASLFVSPMLTIPDTIALFDALKARGLTLCADTTRPKRGETVREARDMLSRLDYFFPNRAEAAQLTGESDPDHAADALLDCGVRHVAVKLGAEGCLVRSRHERHLIPAYPVSLCIDTTGAGDTFAAGFIAALLEGKSLPDCARFANAAASLCVESVGANAAPWTRADVDSRSQKPSPLGKVSRRTAP